MDFEHRATLSTPGGKPASIANAANITAAPGSRSDGFNTIVFPAVTANGNIHSGIIAGKLNGHIPAAQGVVHVSLVYSLST